MTRREVLREAIQRGADEEGCDITEAEEAAAIAFLDSIIPKDAEVMLPEDFGLGTDTEESDE